MPVFNFISIVFQIVIFLSLLFILNLIVYRPIRGILIRRKEEMSSSADQANNWMRKADEYSEEIEENMVTLRSEGIKEKSDLRNIGLETEKELIDDAYAKVEEKANKAKEEIKEKINKARVSLQEEMEGFSHELAAKILGRSL
jgi:F-type H+-transporting ATPase subunit b